MNISVLQPHLPVSVFAQLPDVMTKFGIDDALKLAHFISQCDFESEQFTAVRENLNYSAQALLNTFPTHFNATTAQTYARQPEKIANHVYANRMGNGDENSGDGWNFRGRGYIQLTGKVNYKALSNFLNTSTGASATNAAASPAAASDPSSPANASSPPVPVDLLAHPDLVATIYPLSSAAFFFHNNDLFAVCERGSTTAIITTVTKVINGGTNGLTQRINAFNKYFPLINQASA